MFIKLSWPAAKSTIELAFLLINLLTAAILALCLLHKSFYWLIKNFSIYCHHFALSCAQIRAQFPSFPVLPVPLAPSSFYCVLYPFNRSWAYYGVHGVVIAYFLNFSLLLTCWVPLLLIATTTGCPHPTSRTCSCS